MKPHEWEWSGPDGREYRVLDFPFIDVDGSTLIMEMGIDITDHKNAEQEIQTLNRELEKRVAERTAQLATANEELQDSKANLQLALNEKETILKEIHHRVKNNLQIIHSMLNLQLSHIKDAKAIEMFKESKDRVYSMALIHEKLYQSESLANIDLGEYIPSLLVNLFHSYGAAARGISQQINIEPFTLSIDRVVPCALILNELVSNSLKHAFPSKLDLKGEVRIHLYHADNLAKLTVSDNGIGLPADFKIENCESLGMKLVIVLIKQLRGTIQINTNSNGTEFAVAFNVGE
jgi:two-component sensor histidine kinase